MDLVEAGPWSVKKTETQQATHQCNFRQGYLDWKLDEDKDISTENHILFALQNARV